MTTSITDAGGSTPSDEAVERVARALANEAGYGEGAWQDAGFHVRSMAALARAAIAAMPAPSVDPVGEVGEMIAKILDDAQTSEQSFRADVDWATNTVIHDALAFQRKIATLLQQLADDNARLRGTLRKISDLFGDAVQSDCENGVRSLNERAAAKYLAEFPDTLDAICQTQDLIDATLTTEPFVGERYDGMELTSPAAPPFVQDPALPKGWSRTLFAKEGEPE